MEIILLERIGKLGNIGDTVKVKDGYARNFLFPGKKALKATKENKLIVDQKREKLLEKDKKSLEEAKEISDSENSNDQTFEEDDEEFEERG